MSTGLQQVGFHNVSTYVEQIIEYRTKKISLKIHFNKKTKNYRRMLACSWYCWKALPR
jgi:hypothetical protein